MARSIFRNITFIQNDDKNFQSHLFGDVKEYASLVLFKDAMRSEIVDQISGLVQTTALNVVFTDLNGMRHVATPLSIAQSCEGRKDEFMCIGYDHKKINHPKARRRRARKVAALVS